MPDGKSISGAYRRAGEDFLAYRLEKMFRIIQSPKDIALHNDVMQEVLLMIKNDPKTFFQTLAHKVLFRPKEKARKSLLKIVVGSIFSVSKG